MALYLVLLVAAIRGIHQNHVELIILCVVQHILCQRVAIIHFRRVDIMQQHVSDAKHVRELFLFYPINRIGKGLSILCCLYLLVEGFQP